MSKYKTLLISLIVFCSVVSFGQTKQNCSVSEDNILDRKVCNSEIKWKDSHIIWLLPKVFYSVNVPAGISIVFSKDPEKEILQDFTPNSFILRDVVNKVITVQPKYYWRDEDGVVNLYPIEDYSVLDMWIPYFKIDNQSVSDALGKLLETTEFKNYVKENNLREEDTTFFGTIKRETSKRLSINLQKTTIRGILNEIVKANGNGTWMYGEYESTTDEKRKVYRFEIYH